jgi:NAD(P)-dependent dehydrogenase (short-subunit alcohol dehydrogenase family)
MELNGKGVVVTGGASGIGRAMAERFAAEGARVIAADLNASGDVVACDVSDDAQVGDLIEHAERELGQVDVFCANAGIATGTGLDTADEAWDRIVGVNVMAHVYAARRLVPGWVERGEGWFVSTASAAGLLSQIGDASYAVTKHAAVAFAEWLAITYGSRGVGVSCLCPMGVDTPLLRGGLDLAGEEALGAQVVAAAGHLLSPEQVADDVVAALREERFLILPHPEVREFFRRRGDDHERWLAGMQRLQANVLQSLEA